MRLRFRRLALVGLLPAAALWSVACASDQVAVQTSDTQAHEISTGAPDDRAVEGVIRSYFSCYYRSVEQLALDSAIWDYVADTDETHLYLRHLQYEIDWRQASGSRVVDCSVGGIDVLSASRNDDGTVNIKAYVRWSYRYPGDTSGTIAKAGDTWYLTCAARDGKLKIVALDSQASDYDLAKELTSANLQKHAGDDTYTKMDAIDAAYAEIRATTEQLGSTTTLVP
jgi:hypothetical protein